jgi:carbonic anhydrase
MTPIEALARLRQGNIRFVSARVQSRDVTATRTIVAQDQHPFAVIVGCSDSRVGPEIIFDQGLGDLFDVRTAGHVLDAAAQGSIEYGVHHLHCPLVVVLGHKRCGAVTAAVNHSDEPAEISELVAAIQPVVEQTKDLPGDPVDNAVRANASSVAQYLRDNSAVMQDPLNAGEVQVVSAYYDLDSGHVTFLSQLPSR